MQVARQFREEGNIESARECVRVARESNRHLLRYLRTLKNLLPAKPRIDP